MMLNSYKSYGCILHFRKTHLTGFLTCYMLYGKIQRAFMPFGMMIGGALQEELVVTRLRNSSRTKCQEFKDHAVPSSW